MSNEVAQYRPTVLIDADVMKQARSLADTLGKTNMVPKQYIGKPDDIFVAILMGAQIGLNPFTALQGIATVNGTPSLWGDVMLAVCQSSPKWGGMEESIEIDKSEGIIATCAVKRINGNGANEHVGRFTEADAKTAGLWSKDTYKNYPKQMLARRARSIALRAAFADALKGLGSADELQDVVDVTASAVVKETEVPEPKKAKKRQVTAATEDDTSSNAVAEPTTSTAQVMPTHQEATTPKRINSIEELRALGEKALAALGKEEGIPALKRLCAKYGIERLGLCPPEKFDDFAIDLDALMGLPA